MKYFIKEPERNGNSVELWSTARLQFEPKGWLLEMRKELRSAVERLKCSNDTMLHAIYSSNQRDFCDVENILLYNVGNGAFRNLCHKGLNLERRLVLPPQAPAHLDDIALHYHRYSVDNKKEISQYWKKDKSLAHWIDISCPSLRGENKPHSFWLAMKKGMAQIDSGHPVSSFYGIQVKIKAPVATKVNLASIVKPLLDGTISAFHVHDGTDVLRITGRLAKRLGEDRLIVEKMLMDPQMAVLGTRKLLHTFNQGLQWNPADDLFMEAEILLDDCYHDTKWSFSGEIYTITTEQGYNIR